MHYLLFVLLLTFSFTHAALADCTSPAGAESQTRYDFTTHKLYYCNGTAWVEAGTAGGGGAGNVTVVQQNIFRQKTTISCPAGTLRVGCNHTPPGTWGMNETSFAARPVGTRGCECAYNTYNSACYAICLQ